MPVDLTRFSAQQQADIQTGLQTSIAGVKQQCAGMSKAKIVTGMTQQLQSTLAFLNSPAFDAPTAKKKEMTEVLTAINDLLVEWVNAHW